MAFVMAIGFLIYPFKKNENWLWRSCDIILAILGVVSCIYIVRAFETLAFRQGAPNPLDIVFGLILLAVLLELGRRVVGWILPILCVLGSLYALLGSHLPGILAHRGLPMRIFINTVSLTTEGIFGTPLAVSATYVFMFVLFGAAAGAARSSSTLRGAASEK